MFDIGGGELLALLVLALFVFGPERLPKVAADVARTLRQVRVMIAGAKEDMRRELGPELEGIDLADLNPRTFVKRHLLDDSDLGLDLDEPDREPRSRTPDGHGASPVPRAKGRHRAAEGDARGGDEVSDSAEVPRTPYDADAT